jgi:hypothetical protein
MGEATLVADAIEAAESRHGIRWAVFGAGAFGAVGESAVSALAGVTRVRIGHVEGTGGPNAVLGLTASAAVAGAFGRDGPRAIDALER